MRDAIYRDGAYYSLVLMSLLENEYQWVGSTRSGLLALATLFAVAVVSAQSAPDTGWPNYGNDAGGERYSAARQIDRSNVAQLQVAMDLSNGCDSSRRQT